MAALGGTFLSPPLTAQTSLGDILKRHELVARFDKNGDGRLNPAERAQAQQWIHQERQRTRGGQSLLRHTRLGARRSAAIPGAGEVEHFVGRHWFDPDSLRTIFLHFHDADWHTQLAEFYRTDVEVPARMTVDGEDYPGVGVRYRGSSSYILVSSTRKKSFNIAVDYSDGKARVGGNRTINLLNCNQDPSLIRDAVFARVAGHFVPTPRVNYVRLSINGANWGVYGNAQQFNKDFLADWFGSRKGERWKIERNYGGIGALCYLGDDVGRYRRAYELKSNGGAEAWSRLIRLCRLLNETPVGDREAVLPAVLDVDRTLWFLALEWVFQDGDGYVKQGYDYRLVEDRYGRFLPIPYDNNEILPRRSVAGTLASRIARGQHPFGTDPLEQADNDQRPLISRLLAVPAWRARYLAHVRTIAGRCLDWRSIGPICRSFHRLIEADVALDRRRLARMSEFNASIDELQRLIAARRQAILAHPSLAGPWPETRQVEFSTAPGTEDDGGLRLRVVLQASNCDRASLHYRVAGQAGFQHVDMKIRSGRLSGLTPELPAGSKLEYYVEVRAPGEHGAAAFSPEEAEARPARHTLSK